MIWGADVKMLGVRRKISALFRKQEGATAVEFAMIASVHVALLLGLLETGMVMAKISLLQMGAADATRLVYVGSAANETVTRADIEDVACQFIGRFQSNCRDNMIIELTQINTYTDIPDTEASCQAAGVAASDDIEGDVAFEGGGSSQIMYMRICLTTDIFFPGVGAGLDMRKTDEGKYQIISSAVFSNEPF